MKSNLLSGLEFTEKSLSTTNKHIISDSRTYPHLLIGAILYQSIYHKHLIGTPANPGETTHTTESTVALNIHTQVQMLIHAVFALNWSNYLLKESIKGLLSILPTGFSKVKLNCMPFQVITKFCLTCF